MAINVIILASCGILGVGDDRWIVPPEEVLPKGSAWVEDWRREIRQQTDMLTAAFELDSAMQQMVREEMLVRWRLQMAFEEEHLRPFEGSEADEHELLEKLFWVGEHHPLNKERVAEWLENLLPEQRVKTGHLRLVELWYRRDQQQIVDQSDAAAESRQKARILGARGRGAALSPSGNPIPFGLRLSTGSEETVTVRASA